MLIKVVSKLPYQNSKGSSPLAPLLMVGVLLLSLIIGVRVVENVKENLDKRSRAQSAGIVVACFGEKLFFNSDPLPFAFGGDDGNYNTWKGNGQNYTFDNAKRIPSAYDINDRKVILFQPYVYDLQSQSAGAVVFKFQLEGSNQFIDASAPCQYDSSTKIISCDYGVLPAGPVTGPIIRLLTSAVDPVPVNWTIAGEILADSSVTTGSSEPRRCTRPTMYYHNVDAVLDVPVPPLFIAKGHGVKIYTNTTPLIDANNYFSQKSKVNDGDIMIVQPELDDQIENSKYPVNVIIRHWGGAAIVSILETSPQCTVGAGPDFTVTCSYGVVSPGPISKPYVKFKINYNSAGADWQNYVVVNVGVQTTNGTIAGTYYWVMGDQLPLFYVLPGSLSTPTPTPNPNVGAVCTAAGGKCVSKDTKNLGTGGCFVLTQYDDCGGLATGLTCVPRRNTTCQAPDNSCLNFASRSVNFCGVNTSTDTDVCGNGLCSFQNGQPTINIGSTLPPGQSNPYPGQLCVNLGGVCLSGDTSLISCTQRVNAGYDDCGLGIGSVSTNGSITNVTYSNVGTNLVCVKPESCTNGTSKICEDNYPAQGGSSVKLACGISGFLGTSIEKLTCVDPSQYSCTFQDGSFGCSNNPCDPSAYVGRNLTGTAPIAPTPSTSPQSDGILCIQNGGQCVDNSSTCGYHLTSYDSSCGGNLICGAACIPPIGKCLGTPSKIYCGEGATGEECCTRNTESCDFSSGAFQCANRANIIGGIACLGQSIFKNDSRNPAQGSSGGYVIDSQNVVAGDPIHVSPGTVLMFSIVHGPVGQTTSAPVKITFSLDPALEFWDADVPCIFDTSSRKVSCDLGILDPGGPSQSVIRVKVSDTARLFSSFISAPYITTGSAVSNCFTRTIILDACQSPYFCTSSASCTGGGGSTRPDACTTAGDICCAPATQVLCTAPESCVASSMACSDKAGTVISAQCSTANPVCCSVPLATPSPTPTGTPIPLCTAPDQCVTDAATCTAGGNGAVIEGACAGSKVCCSPVPSPTPTAAPIPLCTAPDQCVSDEGTCTAGGNGAVIEGQCSAGRVCCAPTTDKLCTAPDLCLSSALCTAQNGSVDVSARCGIGTSNVCCQLPTIPLCSAPDQCMSDSSICTAGGNGIVIEGQCNSANPVCCKAAKIGICAAPDVCMSSLSCSSQNGTENTIGQCTLGSSDICCNVPVPSPTPSLPLCTAPWSCTTQNNCDSQNGLTTPGLCGGGQVCCLPRVSNNCTFPNQCVPGGPGMTAAQGNQCITADGNTTVGLVSASCASPGDVCCNQDVLGRGGTCLADYNGPATSATVCCSGQTYTRSNGSVYCGASCVPDNQESLRRGYDCCSIYSHQTADGRTICDPDPDQYGWRVSNNICIACKATDPESVLQQCTYSTQIMCQTQGLNFTCGDSNNPGSCMLATDAVSKCQVFGTGTCGSAQICCKYQVAKQGDSCRAKGTGYDCARHDYLCSTEVALDSYDPGSCSTYQKCGQNCVFNTAKYKNHEKLAVGQSCDYQSPIPSDLADNNNNYAYCDFCPYGYEISASNPQEAKCKPEPIIQGGTYCLNKEQVSCICQTTGKEIGVAELCPKVINLAQGQQCLAEPAANNNTICMCDGLTVGYGSFCIPRFDKAGSRFQTIDEKSNQWAYQWCGNKEATYCLWLDNYASNADSTYALTNLLTQDVDTLINLLNTGTSITFHLYTGTDGKTYRSDVNVSDFKTALTNCFSSNGCVFSRDTIKQILKDALAGFIYEPNVKYRYLVDHDPTLTGPQKDFVYASYSNNTNPLHILQNLINEANHLQKINTNVSDYLHTVPTVLNDVLGDLYCNLNAPLKDLGGCTAKRTATEDSAALAHITAQTLALGWLGGEITANDVYSHANNCVIGTSLSSSERAQFCQQSFLEVLPFLTTPGIQNAIKPAAEALARGEAVAFGNSFSNYVADALNYYSNKLGLGTKFAYEPAAFKVALDKFTNTNGVPKGRAIAWVGVDDATGKPIAMMFSAESGKEAETAALQYLAKNNLKPTQPLLGFEVDFPRADIETVFSPNDFVIDTKAVPLETIPESQIKYNFDSSFWGTIKNQVQSIKESVQDFINSLIANNPVADQIVITSNETALIAQLDKSIQLATGLSITEISPFTAALISFIDHLPTTQAITQVNLLLEQVTGISSIGGGAVDWRLPDIFNFVENKLLAGTPIQISDLSLSSTNAKQVLLDNGYTGVYKAQAFEQDQIPGIPTGSYYLRERAAYLISKTLGFDIIPPTVIRGVSVPGATSGLGSFQYFVEDGKLLEKLTQTELNSSTIQESLVKQLIFDYVIWNAGRNIDNVIINSGRLWAIDNGLSLANSKNVFLTNSINYTVDNYPAIPASVNTIFSQITPDKLNSLSSVLNREGLLSETEVNALLRRIDLIKAYLESRDDINPAMVKAQPNFFSPLTQRYTTSGDIPLADYSYPTEFGHAQFNKGSSGNVILYVDPQSTETSKVVNGFRSYVKLSKPKNKGQAVIDYLRNRGIFNYDIGQVQAIFDQYVSQGISEVPLDEFIAKNTGICWQNAVCGREMLSGIGELSEVMYMIVKIDKVPGFEAHAGVVWSDGSGRVFYVDPVWNIVTEYTGNILDGELVDLSQKFTQTAGKQVHVFFDRVFSATSKVINDDGTLIP